MLATLLILILTGIFLLFAFTIYGMATDAYKKRPGYYSAHRDYEG